MNSILREKKSRISALIHVPFFRLGFFGSCGFFLASAGIIFFRLFPELYGKTFIPLHYNIHFGVDWTGVWWQIFLFPALIFFFLCMNCVSAFVCAKRFSALTTIIMIFTLLISAILFTGTVFAVSVNLVYG